MLAMAFAGEAQAQNRETDPLIANANIVVREIDPTDLSFVLRNPETGADLGTFCNDIGRQGLVGDQHLVMYPGNIPERRNALVLLLGGAGSNPGQYEELSRLAAGLGYAVVNLRYVNNEELNAGTACGDERPDCYTQARGEIIFGRNQDVGFATGRSYNAATAPTQAPLRNINVDKGNSVMNRFACALNFIAATAAPADVGYLSQFLVATPNSPYTNRFGPALPDWSKIIVVGHSTGAANAAFIGKNLPINYAVRRVLMFSGPQDRTIPAGTSTRVSAPWITEPRSTTSVTRFWGYRSEGEGDFGDFVEDNWEAFNGSPGDEQGVGGTAGGAERTIALPSIELTNFLGSHRLTQLPISLTSPSRNHVSTASVVLSPLSSDESARRRRIWRYLLTAGYTD